MSPIELPRALEKYFAFAETEPTRRGRRFAITLPYYRGERLEHLRWWYHVSPAQELQFDGEALNVYRERATARFKQHIEQWLINTQQCLHSDDAIPHISPIGANIDAKTPARPAVEAESAESMLDEPSVVNG